MTDAKPVAPYGLCPFCGSPGVTRERRPNGNDVCKLGHTYPSRLSVGEPKREPDAKPVDVDGLVEALGHQRQCDEDGTDCIVSRQAVYEARELILALQAEVARLTSRVNELETTLTVNSLETVINALAERDRLTQENARLAGENTHLHRQVQSLNKLIKGA